MDPLTALGLAANIAQFIDFGSKLISTTKEIAVAGQSVSVGHLTNVTNDLIDFNSTLKRHIDLDKLLAGSLTKEEEVSCF